MTTKPNILFLMTDQLRVDHCGYIGYSYVETPNIDRIAAGVAFSNCQTVNPICTPARSALLTGKYTHQVGMLSMSGDLSLQHPTYARALREAGYYTAGIGKFHFLQTWRWGAGRGEGLDLVRLREKTKEYGFDHIWEAAGKQLSRQDYCDYCAYLEERGLLQTYWDFVDDAGDNSSRVHEDMEGPTQGEPSPVPETDHVDYVTANEIIRAIRERPGVVSRSRAAADTGRVAPSGAAANGDVGSDQPFFIFGSFLSPHKPFDPPSRYLDDEPEEPQPPLIPGDRSPSATEIQKLRKYRRAYRALVRFLDDQIGRVLDAVEQEGLAESTLVIFSSDHGEMLGDHMRLQKGSYYRESLSVPLAIRMPTASAAAASREPVGQRQSHHAAAPRNPAGSAPEAADSFEAWRVPRPARNAAGGAFVHTPVELTDITATILDAAGLDPRTALSKPWPAFHDRVPCRSLLPVVRSATLAESPRATSEVAELRGPRDFSFSECGGLWQCIQDDEYKYVRELDYADPPAREILYHLASDPHEMQPHEVGDAKADGLSEHEHAELELMRARLQWVMDATPAAQLRWAPLAEEGERYSYPKGF